MDTYPFSYQFFSSTTSAWDAMFSAIEKAEKSVYWEIFIFVDDVIGTRFIELLSKKASAGVDVKLVVDYVGSYKLSATAEKALTTSGVEVLRYNRFYPSINVVGWLWRILSRNHRKVLIVDETTAFLGGVNVQDAFKDWKDIYVRLTGRLVRPLLRAFAKSYISAGGDRKKVRRFLHQRLTEWREWRKKFRFLFHSSRFQRIPRTTQWYIRALAMAQTSVNLVTPYFVPDKPFLKALAAAKERGVKVNLYLPLRTDHKVMELLARGYYRLATRAGAKIFFLPSMHHSKAATIDNRVGIVGSANLSRRSFWLDAEASVEFTDEQMVAELNKIFNDMNAEAVPADQTTFKKLGFFDRAQQWILQKIESHF